MDVCADRQLVGDLHLHLVADIEVDARAGHHAVVGPCLDDFAGAHLPVDDRSGELEALRPVRQQVWLDGLVAEAGGLGREGHDGFDHRLVLQRALGGGRGVVAVVSRRRVADGRRTGVVATDGELRRHPRLGVARDRAVHLVGAGFEPADVEVGGLAGGHVGGSEIGVPHGEVVDHGAVVANRDRPAGGHVRCGQVDGEFGEVGFQALAGNGRLTVRAHREADGHDAGERSERTEGQDQQGPAVSADAVVLDAAFEDIEPRVIVDQVVWHVGHRPRIADRQVEPDGSRSAGPWSWITPSRPGPPPGVRHPMRRGRAPGTDGP